MLAWLPPDLLLMQERPGFSHAPQDHDHERGDHEKAAYRGINGEKRRHGRPGHAGTGCTDSKRHDIDSAHVDTHDHGTHGTPGGTLDR